MARAGQSRRRHTGFDVTGPAPEPGAPGRGVGREKEGRGLPGGEGRGRPRDPWGSRGGGRERGRRDAAARGLRRRAGLRGSEPGQAPA